MSEPYISVVAEEQITSGTLLGPLPLASGSPDSLAVLTWRCVDRLTTSKQVLTVSLKDQATRSLGKSPSWLSHILPARNRDEQTLEIVVKSGQLYFRALRDINSGEELRAWFGEDLADILKLPMISPNIIGGEKRFECLLCQEQFENPFPVVAHLMYRCRQKDQGMLSIHNPLRKKNGGRVKNFDIATLTDMDTDRKETREGSQSPSSNSSSENRKSPLLDVGTDSQFEIPDKKRKLDRREECASPQKKKRIESEREPEKSPIGKSYSSPKPQGGAFKLTAPTNISPYTSLYANESAAAEGNNSSAFKKVDKSNSTFHSNITSLSNLFTGTMDPRDILFQGGPNGFAPFSYPLTPVTSGPSYGGVTLSQNGISLSSAAVEAHMTSAFAPSSKLHSNGAAHHQLKMAEDFKAIRKMPSLPEGGYELGSMMPAQVNGSRMPNMPLPYAAAKSPMDNFPSGKAFPTPLLPFLPPSLAALSFPTQNWCAKCNASFRMTSDLVYHMRSHHKRETDPQKLKREEKLRCHICNETFRERHHLTRHMTSHQ